MALLTPPPWGGRWCQKKYEQNFLPKIVWNGEKIGQITFFWDHNPPDPPPFGNNMDFFSDINKRAFVFIRPQQHRFCFVLVNNTAFVLLRYQHITDNNSKGKERLSDFWIFTRQGHYNQEKATIGLGSDENQEVYSANKVKVVNTVNLVSGAFQQPGQPCWLRTTSRTHMHTHDSPPVKLVVGACHDTCWAAPRVNHGFPCGCDYDQPRQSACGRAACPLVEWVRQDVLRWVLSL